MVLLLGNDPSLPDPQSSVQPLHLRSMDGEIGYDPIPSLSESDVRPTKLFSNQNLDAGGRLERPSDGPKPSVLPSKLTGIDILFSINW